MLHKHGDIETILENLPIKYKIPSSLKDNLDEVRELFKNPDVKRAKEIEIVFTKPDREGLLDFLVGQKGFNQERVLRVLDKINKTKKQIKVDEKQPTIDLFFKKKEGKKV